MHQLHQKNAARNLILLMQIENPESASLELPDKKIFADVAVSVDVTRQKRGQSSRIVVGFICRLILVRCWTML